MYSRPITRWMAWCPSSSSFSSPSFCDLVFKYQQLRRTHFVQRQLAAGNPCYHLISSLSHWVPPTLFHMAPVRLGIIPRTILSTSCSSARKIMPVTTETSRKLVPTVRQFIVHVKKKYLLVRDIHRMVEIVSTSSSGSHT